jgi:hypothetical protein
MAIPDWLHGNLRELAVAPDWRTGPPVAAQHQSVALLRWTDTLDRSVAAV